MTGRLEPARFGIPAVNHTNSRRKHRRLGRSAVDVHRGTVRQDDVGNTTFLHPVTSEASRRLTPVPPDGLTAPSIVVVGPDQKLQSVPAEFEVRREVVDRSLARLRIPEGSGINAQLNHNGSTFKPMVVKFLYRGSWVSESGIPDGDARTGFPALRQLLARESYHAPPQLDWSA
jgi:hypothetical protein